MNVITTFGGRKVSCSSAGDNSRQVMMTLKFRLSSFSVVRQHVGYAVILSFELLLQKCIRGRPIYTTVNYTENI